MPPKMSKDFETALTEDDVQRNSLSLNAVKMWLSQILAALDYLHRNKFCHMDVKGDNILIDYDSTAKLSDFSFLQNVDNPIIRSGAPHLYRPPHLENKMAINSLSFDVWCYGILALNALTKYSMLEDIGSIGKMSFDWWKSIYPTLFKCLQLNNFQSLMSSAFPFSSLKEDNFSEAIDFLHFLLRLEPICRPSAKEALNHIF